MIVGVRIQFLLFFCFLFSAVNANTQNAPNISDWSENSRLEELNKFAEFLGTEAGAVHYAKRTEQLNFYMQKLASDDFFRPGDQPEITILSQRVLNRARKLAASKEVSEKKVGIEIFSTDLSSNNVGQKVKPYGILETMAINDPSEEIRKLSMDTLEERFYILSQKPYSESRVTEMRNILFALDKLANKNSYGNYIYKRVVNHVGQLTLNNPEQLRAMLKIMSHPHIAESLSRYMPTTESQQMLNRFNQIGSNTMGFECKVPLRFFGNSLK